MENNFTFCPNCGTKLPANAAHCSNCGIAQSGLAAAQPIPQAAPQQPVQNEFLSKMSNMAGIGMTQAKQAKEDAKEVYEAIKTKEGFLATIKNVGTFGTVLMAMAVQPCFSS